MEQRIKVLEERYNILYHRSNGEITGVMRKIQRRINRAKQNIYIS